jgi:two-component system, NtrC family, response regulator AtoC
MSTDAISPGATQRRQYQLVVFEGDRVSTYKLPVRGDVRIGRAADNDVRIDDSSISRYHAVLRMNDGLVVEDLGGQNGTYLRARPAGGADGATEDVRRLARRAAAVGVGDSLVMGTACMVVRHQPTLAPRGRGVVVRSAAMKALYEQAALAARSKISVLLLGETGVGKDVLARSIHEMSPRSNAPFNGINCAAVAESLLETELFGCEKGAFTGAVQARAGLLESAHPGTVFLDEIGEMPLATQAKLLRAIEERAVTRVGSTRAREIDVRFIAATNRDLEAAVGREAFRRDLYFRLNGIALVVPPLRERRDEIEPLTRVFLEACARDLSRASPPELSEQALALLMTFAWPGNVRELRNVIERACVLCTGSTIGVEHLPATIVHGDAPKRREPPARKASDPLAIEQALEQCAGNQTRAAKLLGISRRTLITRLAELGIERPRKRIDTTS